MTRLSAELRSARCSLGATGCGGGCGGDNGGAKPDAGDGACGTADASAAQAERPGLRLRRRLPERLLRRRRLLQQRLHRDVQDLQRRQRARICSFVANGAPEQSRDLRGHAPRRPAASTAPATDRDTAASTPPAPCASPAPATAPPSATSTSATARAAARPVPRRSARRSTATRRPTSARRRARRTPTAPPASVRQRQLRPQAERRRVREGHRVQVGVLHRRPLLQRRVQGRLHQLQPAGPRRHLLADRRRRRRSARRLPGPGAGDLRDDGRLRRHRRLRALRGPDRLHRAVVQRRSAEHRRDLQRPRQLPAARDAELRALPVHGRRLHQPLRQRQRLRRRARLPERQLRQEDERPALRRRGRLREQPLRRRRLLRPGLRRRRAAAARCRRRSGRALPVANGGDDPRNMCADQARVDLRHRRKVRRRGRLPHATAPAPSARAEHCENNIYTPDVHLQRDRQLRRARRDRLRPLRLQRQQVLRQLHAPTRTARPATCASATRAARSRTAPSARPGPSASRTSARRASAARPPARAPASRARCRARWDRARTSPASSPDPAQSASTGPATCGTNGKCAGRRLPAVRAGDALRSRQLPGERDHADAGVGLRRRRRVRDAAAELLLPVQVRQPRLQVDLRRRRGLRDARVCNNGSCGLRPPGASCAAPGDCQSGVLRPGRLLHHRLQRKLHVLRAGRHAGHLQAGPGGRHGSRRASAPPHGATSCGKTGFCDGAGDCQLYAAGTQCAPPTCPTSGDHRDARRAPATAPAPAARRRRSPAARTRATAPPATRPAAPTPTARPGTSATPGPAASSVSASSAPAAPNAAAATASTASAAPSAELRQLPVVQRRGHGGHVPPGHGRRDGAARRLRGQPALRVHRPCDGNGACRERPATTSCGTASCSGSTFTNAGNCNGAGVLRAAGDQLRRLRLRRGRRAGPCAAATATARPASPACRTSAPT